MALRSLPRIERLDLSVVTLPEWHSEVSNQATAPVYGYVIDHPDGAIVVDTGVGFGNGFIDEVYRPRSVQLEDALDRVGIDPSSIVGVVNSHLHFDHCGQNPMLYGTDVPFFMQQAEVDEVEHDRFYTDTGVDDGRRPGGTSVCVRINLKPSRMSILKLKPLVGPREWCQVM